MLLLGCSLRSQSESRISSAPGLRAAMQLSSCEADVAHTRIFAAAAHLHSHADCDVPRACLLKKFSSSDMSCCLWRQAHDASIVCRCCTCPRRCSNT